MDGLVATYGDGFGAGEETDATDADVGCVVEGVILAGFVEGIGTCAKGFSVNKVHEVVRQAV